MHQKCIIHVTYEKRDTSGVVAGGSGGNGPISDNFVGALKSTGAAKIRNCQCAILYKYVKSGLSTSSKIVVILAFQLRNTF